ncbi:MAG: hypothetical protein D9V44_06695 [Actinobacteria bacterium]|nr:MAG: hypothetical protein D9V44_06695 [Actinomycetota bacterium]
MALSDIIERIASDARQEADAIIASAHAEAERMVATASAQATESAARLERDSARNAERDAETLLAGARLRARDAEVMARGELVDRALGMLEERIIGLPDDVFTSFIASAVVDAAAGDEAVRVAAADRTRLADLEAAVKSIARARGVELALRFESEAADVAHGVVLIGDRSHNDLSIAGLISAQRESLVMKLASALFAEGKDGS